MNACGWCNGTEGELARLDLGNVDRYAAAVYAHAEHSEPLRMHLERARKAFIPMLTSTFIVLFIVVGGVAFSAVDVRWAAVAFAIAFVTLGVMKQIYPYPTAQTIDLLGMANSIKLSRRLGLLYIAVAAIGSTLGWLYL